MAKVDLHVHSRYSNRPSEWFLRKIGASESYTEPEAIYEIAKRREMSFVTITDHNSIKGSLELAEKYDDAFTGVESTVYFPEDGCKIHLLVWGLTGEQFEQIEEIRRDIYMVRDYLVDQQLAHSVAHGVYSPNHKLTIEHLEKLVLLFDVFESLSGGLSRTSNKTWYHYLQHLDEPYFNELVGKYGLKPQRSNSWVKGFTGGSDDHAGIYIGQTCTLAGAATPEEFLGHVQKRRTFAKGRSNDFQSLAFSVYKIAHDYSRNTQLSIKKMVSLTGLNELIFGERKPNVLDKILLFGMKSDLSSSYKRRIAELIEEIQHVKITTTGSSVISNLELLYDTIADITDEVLKNLIAALRDQVQGADFVSAVTRVSAALPPLFLLVPFFTSLKHLNNNRTLLAHLSARLDSTENRRILWFTDTLNDLNGVSVTLRHLGWKFAANGIDVRIVTSLNEDELNESLPPNMINLPAVAGFNLPYQEAVKIKIPGILSSLKKINDFEPDEIFISTPGPIGAMGLLASKLFNTPVTGIYHTDFTLELNEIESEDDSIIERTESYTRWFYSLMDYIKVPTQAYIDILAERGLNPDKMSVFPRQIDYETFSYRSPEKQRSNKLNLDSGTNLLFVGRVSKDKNLDFLSDVYEDILVKREDINLIITGDGPYREEMQERFKDNDRVVFTGKVAYDSLPDIYSQADLLVFPSVTDTFGMVVLEAHCCELPAIVSDRGGPKEIVQDGRTGTVLPSLNREIWVKTILEMDEKVRMQSDEYLKMRKAARESVMERFSWEAVLRDLTHQELKPSAMLLDD